jgi:hypothetical protein
MSRIYFVLGVKSQRVKVGVSTHFDHRLSQLTAQGPDDLVVLGTIPGDEELEREIHTELSEYHSHFEWFDYTPEVAEAIDKYLHPEAEGIFLDAGDEKVEFR